MSSVLHSWQARKGNACWNLRIKELTAESHCSCLHTRPLRITRPSLRRRHNECSTPCLAQSHACACHPTQENRTRFRAALSQSGPKFRYDFLEAHGERHSCRLVRGNPTGPPSQTRWGIRKTWPGAVATQSPHSRHTVATTVATRKYSSRH